MKNFIRKHHYSFVYGFSKCKGNRRFTHLKYQNFIWFLNCLSVPSKLILSKGDLAFQYTLLGYKADLVNKVVRIYVIIVLGYNKIFPKTRTFSRVGIIKWKHLGRDENTKPGSLCSSFIVSTSYLENCPGLLRPLLCWPLLCCHLNLLPALTSETAFDCSHSF